MEQAHGHSLQVRERSDEYVYDRNSAPMSP